MIRARSPSDAIQVRRPQRQDTFDLRGQIHPDDSHGQMQQQHHYHHEFQGSDEEHLMNEEDDDGILDDGEFLDEEETSSSLSIPNESIDFDLVYAFHSFAATVEGQANVVRGDSLKLMDDSNSYWWLVNVLTTQDIGYIPAENIETPLERLARLNKHRNVDLAAATPQEKEAEDPRRNGGSSKGGAGTPRPRGVAFHNEHKIHNYLPAIWHTDEEYDEEDDDEDMGFEEDEEVANYMGKGNDHARFESEDDGISWEDGTFTEQQNQMDSSTHGAKNLQLQQQTSENLEATQQSRQATQQAQIGLGQPSSNASIRPQTSRERLIGQQQPTISIQISPTLDPEEAIETKRITVTPTLVRDPNRPAILQAGPGGVSTPTVVIGPEYQNQSVSPKRPRDEEDSESSSKRANQGKDRESDRISVARSASQESRLSVNSGSGAKLRKEREKPNDRETGDEREEKKEEKKKRGVLSSLFGRKSSKDKDKEKKSDSGMSGSNGNGELPRRSEDSSRSSSTAHGPSVSPNQASQQQMSGIFGTPPHQTGMSAADLLRNSTDPRKSNTVSPISQHTLKMQQADQAQQALYQQQHLTRTPGSPENVALAPSYGLQSASAFLPSSVYPTSTLKMLTPERERNGRPGSLVLSPTTVDAQGVSVPELTVIRVFAGAGLQTEATFKTVLLNNSTTAEDLVKQAMQRFRLAAGEDPADYYLTVKQLEGTSAELKPNEKPLRVFEGLVEAAQLPKVNRNSVGSISSVASNLSMHPAIRKLSMHDFTDDSAVKFYLNRAGMEDIEDTVGRHDTEITSPHSTGSSPARPLSPGLLKPPAAQSIVITPNSLTPERFSSPSVRFALQLFIFPEDLPDGMIFDPQTEAIIPKPRLKDRSHAAAPVSSGIGISQTKRRKVFVFPKNTTCAEVIELGLERFGILDGVVDGGDEIEDKMAKRRSYTRVRYGLSVQVDGQERVLQPASKVLEAFPRTPIFKEADRRSGEGKRRSADASILLGSPDDVQPDDPIFILRRVAGSRLSSSSHRHSAPLDEIALQRLHRDSTQSSASSNNGDESTITIKQEPPPQLSRQELIAAQRAASRANQRAILSANSNSERGVDLLLPDKAVIRSSQYENGSSGNKIRYSYVEPDGGTYDISEIIEEELQNPSRARSPGVRGQIDLLEGVLVKDSTKLDRVLTKIKDNKVDGQNIPPNSASTTDTIVTASSTQSTYSEDTLAPGESTLTMQPERNVVFPVERSTRPHKLDVNLPEVAVRAVSPTNPYVSRDATPVSRYATPIAGTSASPRTGTPVQSDPSAIRNRSISPPVTMPKHAPQQSITSVKSDGSAYSQSAKHVRIKSPSPTSPKLRIPADYFGLDKMWSIIEVGAALHRQPSPDPIDSIEEMVFGPKLNLDDLHPAIRELYEPLFKQSETLDKEIDDLFMQRIPKAVR